MYDDDRVQCAVCSGMRVYAVRSGALCLKCKVLQCMCIYTRCNVLEREREPWVQQKCTRVLINKLHKHKLLVVQQEFSAQKRLLLLQRCSRVSASLSYASYSRLCKYLHLVVTARLVLFVLYSRPTSLSSSASFERTYGVATAAVCILYCRSV